MLKTIYHTPKLTLKIRLTHTHSINYFLSLCLPLYRSHSPPRNITGFNPSFLFSLLFLSLHLLHSILIVSLSHTHSIPLSRSLSVNPYMCASMFVCVCVCVCACVCPSLILSTPSNSFVCACIMFMYIRTPIKR